MKQRAIKLSIEAMSKAKTFKGNVGACIYTDEECYIGFNIETKIHKGYHAEEVAIINSMLNNIDPKTIKGIIIVYVFKGNINNNIYPACASCRQFLWELTNPNILITVIDLEGKVMYEDTLKSLYPFPYPLTKEIK
jgi:cytidine deaminase